MTDTDHETRDNSASQVISGEVLRNTLWCESPDMDTCVQNTMNGKMAERPLSTTVMVYFSLLGWYAHIVGSPSNMGNMLWAN